MKAGGGSFLSQRAKAFSANIIFFEVPLMPFYHRAPLWLSDPPVVVMCTEVELVGNANPRRKSPAPGRALLSGVGSAPLGFL